MDSSKIAARIAQFELIHISNPREDTIHGVLDEMRMVGRHTVGRPQKGIQFLAPSFSGKSTILKSYADKANAEAAAGAVPVFYMELASATTPNQMLDQLLTTLGDTARVSSEAQRLKRACDISRDRCIELFLFDEVQHLISNDTARVAWRVTEAMKRLLNEGVAPIAFGGDLSATSLFRSNPQLRNRLLTPVELPPLDYSNTADTSYASIFFDRLDQKMVDDGLMSAKASLGSGQIPSALCAASSGVLGTRCNIVREALRIALKRNARKISAQDISDAIDNWAIPQGFAPSNPLRGWREAA